MSILSVLRRHWFWPAFILLVGAAALWRVAQPYPIYDVYPIYFGGQAWLSTGSAYDLNAAVDPLELYSRVGPDGARVTPYDQMHRYGNAYPFPAVAWLLPLSLLPARAFSIVWFAALVAGLLLTLRWVRAPIWLIFYVAVWHGLRLEQFAIVVLIAQLIGLHIHAAGDSGRRGAFVIAVCCAVMLLKPTQGGVLALALLAISRPWRHWPATLLGFGLVWGLPTLLDPGWVGEWLAAGSAYRAESQQYIPFLLLLAAVPPALARDWVTAAVVAQFAISPYTWVYTAMSFPAGLIRDRRFPLLVLISLPTLYLAALLLDPLSKAQAEIAAITLTMLLPAVALSLARWREARVAPAAPAALPEG